MINISAITEALTAALAANGRDELNAAFDVIEPLLTDMNNGSEWRGPLERQIGLRIYCWPGDIKTNIRNALAYLSEDQVAR